MAPAAPLTLPSPPKGRGRQERAARAGMTAVGRPAPACHPRAWPLHGGRDARRASPFPDSSPPAGERIKVRGGRSAQAESKAEGGRTQRLEVAPAAPLTLPSPPKARGRQERTPRAGMTAVGRPAPACHPRAWPLHGGRDRRRASPFPDSSPPPGERIVERVCIVALRSRWSDGGRGGCGGASARLVVSRGSCGRRTCRSV